MKTAMIALMTLVMSLTAVAAEAGEMTYDALREAIQEIRDGEDLTSYQRTTAMRKLNRGAHDERYRLTVRFEGTITNVTEIEGEREVIQTKRVRSSGKTWGTWAPARVMVPYHEIRVTARTASGLSFSFYSKDFEAAAAWNKGDTITTLRKCRVEENGDIGWSTRYITAKDTMISAPKPEPEPQKADSAPPSMPEGVGLISAEQRLIAAEERRKAHAEARKEREASQD